MALLLHNTGDIAVEHVVVHKFAAALLVVFHKFSSLFVPVAANFFVADGDPPP